MDKVDELQVLEVPAVVPPTRNIFLPLLEEIRPQIKNIPNRTFQYGGTDRHQLDIYYPTSAPSNGKTPVLFFIYGGGFVMGERSGTTPPGDLSYDNLGAYFAQKGFVTVIPDYRLVPNVVFPEPARDVRDAMEWIVTNRDQLIFGGVTDPDVDLLLVMGHSAGASHIFTVLALPELYSSILHPKIKGAILISAPYHFEPVGSALGSEQVVVMYWGSMEEAKKTNSSGLLKAASAEKVASFPDILLVEAERDPEGFKIVGKDFHEALEGRLGAKVQKIYAKRHNHISVTFALGLKEGEEWAEEAIDWMKATLSG